LVTRTGAVLRPTAIQPVPHDLADLISSRRLKSLMVSGTRPPSVHDDAAGNRPICALNAVETNVEVSSSAIGLAVCRVPGRWSPRVPSCRVGKVHLDNLPRRVRRKQLAAACSFPAGLRRHLGTLRRISRLGRREKTTDQLTPRSQRLKWAARKGA